MTNIITKQNIQNLIESLTAIVYSNSLNKLPVKYKELVIVRGLLLVFLIVLFLNEVT